MIRPATIGDLEAIIDIAMLETRRYPMLRPDRQKIRALAVDAISSAKHFCYVSEDSGKVSGVLAAFGSNNTWAERQSCHIMLWTAKIVGDGRKMLRACLDWIQSRRATRVAGFAPDTDTIDPRVWLLVERMGFRRYGGAYLFYN